MFKRTVTFILTCAIVAVSLSVVFTLDIFAASGNTDYVDYGSTVYYVDSVNGNDNFDGTSEIAPWKTLDRVNKQTFAPGDQILFKSGGVWSGRLIPQGSGTEGKPITIGKYGGDIKPILKGDSNFLDGFYEGSTILLYNQEYWEIYDLEITNTSSSAQATCMGIWIVAEDFGTADHFVIERCYLHKLTGNWRSSTMNTIKNYGGITDNYAYTGGARGAIQFSVLVGGEKIPSKFNDVEISNNEIADCTRTGIIITSDWGDHQVAGANETLFEETTFSTNIHIANNLIHGTGAALEIFYVDGSVGDGCVVENNVCYDNNNGHSYWVMWSSLTIDLVYQNNEIYNMHQTSGADDGLFDADGQSVGTIFQYNYTHHNAGPAYVFCEIEWDVHSFPDSYVTGCAFRYNISYNDNWMGSQLRNKGTLFSVGAEDGYYYNNLMYTDGYDVKLFDIKLTNGHVYNNIFYSTGDGNVTYQYYGEVNDTDERMSYVSNNCFYGIDRELPATNLAHGIVAENNILADPKMTFIDSGNPGDWNSGIDMGFYGIDTLVNSGAFKLQEGSPCIGAGKIINYNGGRDFFGNTVSKNKAPDIGPHQYTAVEGAPTAIENLTASNVSTERFDLSWNDIGGDSDFTRYQVFLNGKAYNNYINGHRRTEDFDLLGPWQGIAEIFDGNSATILDLTPGTEYEVFMRGYNADGSFVESDKITVTTTALGSGENQLRAGNIKVYRYNRGDLSLTECDSFVEEDIIHCRLQITDGAGRPVRGVLVHALFEAVGLEYEIFDVATTDTDGYAKFGITAAYLPSSEFEYKITAYSIKKDGYVFSGTAPTTSVSSKGYSNEYNSNLLNNSDFSDIGSNGLPSSWKYVNSNSISLIQNTGPNGDVNGLDIRSQNATASQISQVFTNIPNGTYTLTAWVKNNNSASTIGVNNTGHSTFVSVPMNEEWNQIVMQEVKVSTNRVTVYLTVPQFGDYSVYTQVCNIELTKNLMYNSDMTSIKPSSVVTLPAHFYYQTANTTINIGDTDMTAAEADVNLKAVGLRYYNGDNYLSSLYINSDEAFSLSMGQYKSNLESGNYTFSASTMSTGGINGYLRIRDGESGAVLGSVAIDSSSRYTTTKVTAKVTSNSAYAEFVFEGTGDPTESIDIQNMFFANCSDLDSGKIMTVLPGQNLMDNLNGDFEQDGKATNSIPTSWKLNDYKGYFNAYVSDEDSVTGKFSMKCTLDELDYHNAAGGGQKTSGAATPIMEFTNLPAGTYTFSWWSRGNVRYKMGCKTDHRANDFMVTVSDISDTWQQYTITDIKVNDGTLIVVNWFDRAGYDYPQDATEEMLWAFIDSVTLTMDNVDYTVNGSAEEVSSKTPSNWTVTDSQGLATLISTNEAVVGEKSAMAVLPSTNSSLTVSCATKSGIEGTYTFSAWVRGNGIITFNIKSDAETTARTLRVEAPDDWQQVIIEDIPIKSAIEELSFTVINADGNRSSFVCIDEMNITSKIDAKVIAETLPGVSAIPLGENLTVPQALVDGYTVTLYDSSNTDIIALDGAVTTPDSNQFLTLTFKIVNNDDPANVAYASRIVTVYGFE